MPGQYAATEAAHKLPELSEISQREVQTTIMVTLYVLHIVFCNFTFVQVMSTYLHTWSGVEYRPVAGQEIRDDPVKGERERFR